MTDEKRFSSRVAFAGGIDRDGRSTAALNGVTPTEALIKSNPALVFNKDSDGMTPLH